MNERIKKVRIDSGMNQTEFGSALNLSRVFISLVESGEKNPSSRTINDICNKFHVNENWLRNGEGEMYQDRTENEIIADFMMQIMESSEDDMRRRFINSLSKLEPEQWELIANILDSFVADNEKKKGTEE